MRILVPIGVAYGSDVDLVMRLLLDLATAQPEILKDPQPEVIFLNHGASSLDFELRAFIPNPTLRWPIRSRINKLINKTFAENNIQIPFPQQDIHLRSGFSFSSPTTEVKP